MFFFYPKKLLPMGPLDPRLLSLSEYRLRCVLHAPWYTRLRRPFITLPRRLTPLRSAPRIAMCCASFANARRLAMTLRYARCSFVAAVLALVCATLAYAPGRFAFRPTGFLFIEILRYTIIFCLKCTKKLADCFKWCFEKH